MGSFSRLIAVHPEAERDGEERCVPSAPPAAGDPGERHLRQTGRDGPVQQRCPGELTLRTLPKRRSLVGQ